jgi:hypothetical protein
MPQLAQGRELGEAKKPESVAVLRLAFQCADHERASEALSEAKRRDERSLVTLAPFRANHRRLNH